MQLRNLTVDPGGPGGPRSPEFPCWKKNLRKLRLATKTRMNSEIVRPTESGPYISITALQHKNPTVLESISPLAIYIALFFRSTPRRNMIGFFARGQLS